MKVESRLKALNEEVISQRRNDQNRSIRMITGHMVDSASNNTHRIVHLQYRKSPLSFPNYATRGNNDRWIAIQHYQEENWKNLVQHWKYIHLHLVHVISYVDESMLEQEWIAGPEEGKMTLAKMIENFPRHFRLHIDEIDALIKQGVLWD